MTKAQRELLQRIQQHPDEPVCRRKFRIQVQISRRLVADFYPHRTREEMKDEWIHGKSKDFLKVERWASEIAIGRLTPSQRVAWERNGKECLGLRRQFARSFQ